MSALRTIAIICATSIYPAFCAAHPNEVTIPIDVTYAASAETLPNGNILIVDSYYSSEGISRRGRVLLLNPDGSIRATLLGAGVEDQIGSGGATVLSNGNVVVQSPLVDSAVLDSGAVTWMSGAATGTRVVSPSTSVVGTTAGARIGVLMLSLESGDYIVADIAGGRLIKFSGDMPFAGAIGAFAGVTSSVTDLVDVSALSLPNGDIVLTMPKFRGGTGAVSRWASANFQGEVSEATAMIGRRTGDLVGSGGVTVLNNGNFVICSPNVSASGSMLNAGAATFVTANGTLTGNISADNSLIGANADDHVCSGGIVKLRDSANYVVVSPDFQMSGARSGAATWARGTAGLTGIVSPTNSLVGVSRAGTFAVNNLSVVPLATGNYAVMFSGTGATLQDDPLTGGPVLLGSRDAGISGRPTSANAVFVRDASRETDALYALSGGGFAVYREMFTAEYAAIHSYDGRTLTPGEALSSSALLIRRPGSVVPLSNGTFAVISSVGFPSSDSWITRRSDASTASLIAGSENSVLAPTSSISVVALPNASAVVKAPFYDSGRGLWSWLPTTTWTGTIDRSNAVIGTDVTHSLGSDEIIPFSDGSFLAVARANSGAVCEYSGNGPISGGVNPAYCFIGTIPLDYLDIIHDPSERYWAVLQPYAQKLTIVPRQGSTLFRSGFE